MTVAPSDDPGPGDEPTTDLLNLKQVARLLDVHYMTVYRYVRQGRLPAQRVGAIWMVEPSDAEALLADDLPAAGAAVDWTERLATRLAAGDEVGGWTVLREALSAGRDYRSVHLEVVAGAVAAVGADVAHGRSTPAHERVAVATASRLVARLGGQFAHRGRKRGTVVLAAPVGEHHSLSLLLVANLIRHAGFRVTELGTDTPAADVLDAVAATTDLVALGLGVTTVDRFDAAQEVIAAVRAVHPSLPILLGGQAVRNAEVAELIGARHWAAGPDLVDRLHAIADERRDRSTPAR